MGVCMAGGDVSLLMRDREVASEPAPTPDEIRERAALIRREWLHRKAYKCGDERVLKRHRLVTASGRRL